VTSAGSYRVSIVVDRSRFPKLFQFVEWRIDVQLAEVRELLRLPMPEVGLESRQTFAAAASLVNLIAGASVWLYDASTAGLSDRESGRRFRETLAAYGRGMTARSLTKPKAYACSMSASAIRWRMVSACQVWTTRVRRSPFSKSR